MADATRVSLRTRVARDFPVSDTQVRNIVRGDQWATAQPASVARKPCRAVLDSVWLGVSAEDQQRAELRIPALLETPAAVRFLSCEPLLGAVNLRQVPTRHGAVLDTLCGDVCTPQGEVYAACPASIDWTIVGGESGPGSREMDEEWVRRIVADCRDAGVPVFVKQLGSVWAQARGADGKGGDPSYWPADLRVREFPSSAAVPA